MKTRRSIDQAPKIDNKLLIDDKINVSFLNHAGGI